MIRARSLRFPAAAEYARATAAVMFLSGALLFTTAPPVRADEPPLEIVVKPGDTLNELCKQHLQDPARCMEIARINQLKNPDRIEPGERIAIPAGYLKTKPAPAMQGTATFVKGDVVVRDKDAAGWRLLALHDPVIQGSRVRTGPDGSAELSFEDSSSLLLRPNTELTVTTLRSEQAGFIKRFFLDIGRIVSKAVKRENVSSRLEIETATAVAGTRGTRFGLTVLEDRTTRAEVQEGAIGVSAMGKEVEVREGEGTVVKQGMQPAAPSRLLPRPAPADLKQSYSAMPITIGLAHVEGARQHRAALSRDREGRDVAAEQVLAPGEAFQATDLQDGTYYLHLRSIDEQGLEGLESDPTVLQVRLELPPAPPPAPDMQKRPERGVGEAVLTIIFVVAAILI